MKSRRTFPIEGTPQMPEHDDINARNQAAANVWQQRVREIAGGDDSDASEPSRIALAKALGEDPSTPAGALQARFRSLPPNVQAGIYKRGGAQFIGGVEGSKMIENLAADKEKHLDALTSQVAEHLASGKINYDLDKEGKPAFYELVDDANDPLGRKKIKQPLNTLRLQMLQRGFEKGVIPGLPSQAVPQAPLGETDPTKTGKMSAESFQQILDARARGVDPSSRALMTGPMPVGKMLSETEPTGMPAATQQDSAMQLHDYLAGGGLSQSGTNIGTSVADTLSSLASSVPDAINAGISNPFLRMGNALGRVAYGEKANQVPMIPYLSNQPAEDPRTKDRDIEDLMASYAKPSAY